MVFDLVESWEVWGSMADADAFLGRRAACLGQDEWSWNMRKMKNTMLTR